MFFSRLTAKKKSELPLFLVYGFCAQTMSIIGRRSSSRMPGVSSISFGRLRLHHMAQRKPAGKQLQIRGERAVVFRTGLTQKYGIARPPQK